MRISDSNLFCKLEIEFEGCRRRLYLGFSFWKMDKKILGVHSETSSEDSIKKLIWHETRSSFSGDV